MVDELVPAFMRIGLTEQKAKETAKNKQLSANLAVVIAEAEKHSSSSQDLAGHGTLLYHVASKLKAQVFHLAPLLVELICRGKLDSELRLNAAIEYVVKIPPNMTAKVRIQVLITYLLITCC
jgi:glutaminyl-tRNA synthetase